MTDNIDKNGGAPSEPQQSSVPADENDENEETDEMNNEDGAQPQPQQLSSDADPGTINQPLSSPSSSTSLLSVSSAASPILPTVPRLFTLDPLSIVRVPSATIPVIRTTTTGKTPIVLKRPNLHIPGTRMFFRMPLKLRGTPIPRYTVKPGNSISSQSSTSPKSSLINTNIDEVENENVAGGIPSRNSPPMFIIKSNPIGPKPQVSVPSTYISSSNNSIPSSVSVLHVRTPVTSFSPSQGLTQPENTSSNELNQLESTTAAKTLLMGTKSPKDIIVLKRPIQTQNSSSIPTSTLLKGVMLPLQNVTSSKIPVSSSSPTPSKCLTLSFTSTKNKSSSVDHVVTPIVVLNPSSSNTTNSTVNVTQNENPNSSNTVTKSVTQNQNPSSTKNIKSVDFTSNESSPSGNDITPAVSITSNQSPPCINTSTPAMSITLNQKPPSSNNAIESVNFSSNESPLSSNTSTPAVSITQNQNSPSSTCNPTSNNDIIETVAHTPNETLPFYNITPMVCSSLNSGLILNDNSLHNSFTPTPNNHLTITRDLAHQRPIINNGNLFSLTNISVQSSAMPTNSPTLISCFPIKSCFSARNPSPSKSPSSSRSSASKSPILTASSYAVEARSLCGSPTPAESHVAVKCHSPSKSPPATERRSSSRSPTPNGILSIFQNRSPSRHRSLSRNRSPFRNRSPSRSPPFIGNTETSARRLVSPTTPVLTYKMRCTSRSSRSPTISPSPSRNRSAARRSSLSNPTQSRISSPTTSRSSAKSHYRVRRRSPSRSRSSIKSHYRNRRRSPSRSRSFTKSHRRRFTTKNSPTRNAVPNRSRFTRSRPNRSRSRTKSRSPVGGPNAPRSLTPTRRRSCTKSSSTGNPVPTTSRPTIYRSPTTSRSPVGGPNASRSLTPTRRRSAAKHRYADKCHSPIQTEISAKTECVCSSDDCSAANTPSPHCSPTSNRCQSPQKNILQSSDSHMSVSESRTVPSAGSSSGSTCSDTSRGPMTPCEDPCQDDGEVSVDIYISSNASSSGDVSPVDSESSVKIPANQRFMLPKYPKYYQPKPPSRSASSSPTVTEHNNTQIDDSTSSEELNEPECTNLPNTSNPSPASGYCSSARSSSSSPSRKSSPYRSASTTLNSTKNSEVPAQRSPMMGVENAVIVSEPLEVSPELSPDQGDSNGLSITHEPGSPSITTSEVQEKVENLTAASSLTKVSELLTDTTASAGSELFSDRDSLQYTSQLVGSNPDPQQTLVHKDLPVSLAPLPQTPTDTLMASATTPPITVACPIQAAPVSEASVSIPEVRSATSESQPSVQPPVISTTTAIIIQGTTPNYTVPFRQRYFSYPEVTRPAPVYQRYTSLTPRCSVTATSTNAFKVPPSTQTSCVYPPTVMSESTGQIRFDLTVPPPAIPERTSEKRRAETTEEAGHVKKAKLDETSEPCRNCSRLDASCENNDELLAAIKAETKRKKKMFDELSREYENRKKLLRGIVSPEKFALIEKYVESSSAAFAQELSMTSTVLPALQPAMNMEENFMQYMNGLMMAGFNTSITTATTSQININMPVNTFNAGQRPENNSPAIITNALMIAIMMGQAGSSNSMESNNVPRAQAPSFVPSYPQSNYSAVPSTSSARPEQTFLPDMSVPPPPLPGAYYRQPAAPASASNIPSRARNILPPQGNLTSSRNVAQVPVNVGPQSGVYLPHTANYGPAAGHASASVRNVPSAAMDMQQNLMTMLAETITNMSPGMNMSPVGMNVSSMQMNAPSMAMHVRSGAINVPSAATNIRSGAVNFQSATMNVLSGAMNVPSMATNFSLAATNFPPTVMNVQARAMNVQSGAINVPPTAMNTALPSGSHSHTPRPNMPVFGQSQHPSVNQHITPQNYHAVEAPPPHHPSYYQQYK